MSLLIKCHPAKSHTSSSLGPQCQCGWQPAAVQSCSAGCQGGLCKRLWLEQDSPATAEQAPLPCWVPWGAVGHGASRSSAALKRSLSCSRSLAAGHSAGHCENLLICRSCCSRSCCYRCAWISAPQHTDTFFTHFAILTHRNAKINTGEYVRLYFSLHCKPTLDWKSCQNSRLTWWEAQNSKCTNLSIYHIWKPRLNIPNQRKANFILIWYINTVSKFHEET